MKRWVKLTDTLTVDPELIAAVVVKQSGWDAGIYLVPVMASSEEQWLYVDGLSAAVISTYETPDVWDGKPITRTNYVREDADTMKARVQERVDAITAMLKVEGPSWSIQLPTNV